MFPDISRHILLIMAVTPLLVSGNCVAQCNDWEKLIAYEGVYVNDVARDRFGNLYAVGAFNSPNFVIDGTAIPLYGYLSMFILKFDKDFSLQWARSVGNDEGETAAAIELDKNDNPVVAGYFFSSSIRFDCITLVRASRQELFLVKYHPDGDVQWALGTTALEDGFHADIAVDKSNNVVLTGSYVANTFSFGGKTIQKSGGGYDSFVTSVTASGTVSWMRSFGGSKSPMPDYIQGVATDADGNIVITGLFESDFMVFDDFRIPKKTISENFFIAKLNSQGVTLWAKGSGGSADNSGMDIGVDNDNNIIIAGRFQNTETAFDHISLSSSGEADIYVVKYRPDGEVLQARSFGGPRFDTAQKLAFDAEGNVVIGGYFYTYSLAFDSFVLNKPEFQSDVFLVTLDNDLNAICTKQISGPAENAIGSLHIDRSDNIWVTVDNILGNDETNFGNTFMSTESTMIAAVGNTDSFDPYSPAETYFRISLGQDIEKCPQEKVTLEAGEYCNATYTWSTGSQAHSLEVYNAGVFWVEVVWNGRTARDTIVIQTTPPLEVDLGDDVEICPAASVSFDVTQDRPTSYEWSDGTTSPTNTFNSEGQYSVKVQDECEAKYDFVKISFIKPILLDLGKDTVVCGTNAFTIGKEIPGAESYRWQDNSNAPTLVIASSGLYEQTVSNECEEVKDEIMVTFKDEDETFIPNIVTDDGDFKNDRFVISAATDQPVSLTVFNRWGTTVFATDNYQNNWPDSDLRAGVYFYLLKGSCAKEFRGSVHLFK